MVSVFPTAFVSDPITLGAVKVAGCQRSRFGCAGPQLNLAKPSLAAIAVAQTTRRVLRRVVARRALKPLPRIEAAEAATALHFSRMANWLAPGHVLVGRYPLTDPDESEGRQHLRRLVAEAKVSTFVCVQSEVPPQDDLVSWSRGVKVKGRKCLPYGRMAQQFAGGRKLNFIHEPLDDFEAPDGAHLDVVIADLDKRVQSGETLLVHCMGGRGRSACVAGCLLASLYGISADEALKRVQQGYDSRGYDDSVSPETEKQRQVLRDFCDRMIHQEK